MQCSVKEVRIEVYLLNSRLDSLGHKLLHCFFSSTQSVSQFSGVHLNQFFPVLLAVLGSNSPVSRIARINCILGILHAACKGKCLKPLAVRLVWQVDSAIDEASPDVIWCITL